MCLQLDYGGPQGPEHNEETKSLPSSAPVVGSRRGSEFEQGRETHLQVSVLLCVRFPAKEQRLGIKI